MVGWRVTWSFTTLGLPFFLRVTRFQAPRDASSLFSLLWRSSIALYCGLGGEEAEGWSTRSDPLVSGCIGLEGDDCGWQGGGPQVVALERHTPIDTANKDTLKAKVREPFIFQSLEKSVMDPINPLSRLKLLGKINSDTNSSIGRSVSSACMRVHPKRLSQHVSKASDVMDIPIQESKLG
ncbi:hypothetical protein MA16_Dca013890 [Dendrobium catenatum]|uniref:Uncharacterized protein n=1 Tax=Dendrobium catenatum TaxID=906689 RepID=A0A2I0WCP7_9ASPA|nr:hypothetical protein MA16_Dca013890 [Dendrobium catenatum]